jgi:hypothetical protein
MIIGFIIFIVHMLYYELWGIIRGYRLAHNGFLGSVIAGFIFIFWIYALLSYIYIRRIKGEKNRSIKYFQASFIVFIGYIISRIPDIIGSHFFEKFNWNSLLVYFIFIPLLVEMEIFLKELMPSRVDSQEK